MANDFMLLFIEYQFTLFYCKRSYTTYALRRKYVYVYACGIYASLCSYMYVCAYGYSYGLIDMRIYVFVSASACSPFLSDILTRPQYFFISFTLLIVLLYCCVLWCCTFVTGQPLTLIKMMTCNEITLFEPEKCDWLWRWGDVIWNYWPFKAVMVMLCWVTST